MIKNYFTASYLFILILTIGCIGSFTAAQVQLEWVRTYQGPIPGSGIDVMTIDKNDFIYVSGVSISSAVAYDIATIKYNKSGDSLWVRRYSSGSQCQVDDILVDNNGNVYITGFTVLDGMPRALTIKYNSNGDLMWQKIYARTPDNRSIGIGIDQSGFIYIAGSTYHNGNDWGVEVVKYNPDNGDTIWTVTYDYSLNSIDLPKAMSVDSSGNVFVCGQSMADSARSFLVKFNSNGALEWASLYKIPGISGEIYGEVLKLDDAGNIYFAGHCYNGQATFVDYLVAKYNPDGTPQWIKTYSNTNNGIDEAYDLAVDQDYNVYVTGKSYIGGGGSNNYDYLTVKFSPEGNPIWQARYNNDPQGPTQDEAYAIVVDVYGNCYVTGVSSKSSLYNSEGFATVKYDKDGNEIWRIRNDGWWYCIGYAIGLDSDNMVYVGGSLTSQFGLLKYFQPPIPVELTSFNALAKNASVELNWTTASETNNQGFEILKLKYYKSNSQPEWEVIGFVEGAGTTAESRSYTYYDNNISEGEYSYRLKQIDYDGRFELSRIIEVEIITVKEFVLKQNYPNPFNPSTTIEFSLLADSRVVLKVYNVLGQEIKTLINKNMEAGVHSIGFNASSLPSGIYLYKIEAYGTDGMKSVSIKKMTLTK